MSSILETLMQQLGGGDAVRQVSRQLGADEGRTESALSAALPTLLAALSRNASRPEGAEALHRAVARDHDGSVLDDLSGFLGQAQDGPGAGILRHVLRDRRGTVEGAVSRASGLDGNATGKLMEMLAPMVMGALGREQRRGGLDAGGLAGLLERERSAAADRVEPKQMSMVDRLLDADDDGDVDLGDLLKHGAKLFGRR
jgi:hypothetical protein